MYISHDHRYAFTRRLVDYLNFNEVRIILYTISTGIDAVGNRSLAPKDNHKFVSIQDRIATHITPNMLNPSNATLSPICSSLSLYKLNQKRLIIAAACSRLTSCG